MVTFYQRRVHSKKWLGVIAASEKITVVFAGVPDTGPLVVQSDATWPLQSGDRPQAYAVMHKHVSDFVRENKIDRVVIKASALSMGSTKKAHLEACELRGVVAGAAASITETEFIAKAHMSRTFGSRKVDDYLADTAFWKSETSGATVRIGSREAALVLLAARK